MGVFFAEVRGRVKRVAELCTFSLVLTVGQSLLRLCETAPQRQS